MVCHNCCKCYLFNSYFNIDEFEKYDDIFPFPELFHLSKKDQIIGYSLIDNQRKNLELSIKELDISNPFFNITNINKKILSRGKNNKLIIFLNLVQSNDLKYHKYIKNESYLLIKNYTLENNTINLSYMPELALYNKNNEIKCFDLYSKIYWPYANFINYYLKFIKKDMTYDYLSCINKQINRNYNKYKVEDLLIGWGDKYKNFEDLINEFEKLPDNLKHEQFTNKIFYKINDNNNTNILINFQNIYHLFELDINIPYMSSYIPEESIILEKIFRKQEKEIKAKDWKLFNKNIVHFRVLLPEDVIGTKDKQYFQVNLYENMKLEVNVPIPTTMMKYVTKDKLLKINQRVNHLIERLNSTNIFNFSDLKIPLSNTNFEDWNKEKSISNINSMNFYLKLESKIDEGNMIKILNNLNKCMNIYYHKDFDFAENNFRYKRINNVSLSDVTDRFIYHTYNAVVQEFNLDNEKEIRKIILERLQQFFDKTIEESISIYENYKMRYKSFVIKPLNYGLYFNIKEPDEWKDIESDTYSYKVTIMGMRDYKDWNKIKSFILKLFYLIEGIINNINNVKKIRKICNLNKIEKEDKIVVKKDTYLAYQQEKFQCGIEAREKTETIKNTKDAKLKKKLQNEKDKIIKRREQLETMVIQKKKQMKKASIKNISTYLQRLQEIYPNLKMQCPECGANPNSKECQSCQVPLEQSQYAKKCQKKRQPMGTGLGAEPQIIDFNKEDEEQRFSTLDKVECNYEGKQKGGTILSSETSSETSSEMSSPVQQEKIYGREIYENWGMKNNPTLFPGKMNLKFCKNVPKASKGKQGYNIKSLKKIAPFYDISVEGKKKIQICKEIIEKIQKSEKGKMSTKKLLEQYKIALQRETNNDNKLILKYLIKYYERPKQEYDFKSEEDLNKIGKKLGIKFQKGQKIIEKKKIILNELSKIFYGDFQILKNKFIDFLDLNNTVNALNNTKLNGGKTKIIKDLIYYNIYNITPKWGTKHLQRLYSALTSKTTVSLSKKELKLKINETFSNFETKYLSLKVSNGIQDMNGEFDFEDFKKQTGLITRQDKHGNIIQSTMSFKGKAISCPNFDDNKNNTLVGFLDIDYENKNNYKDNKIRDMVCQPCCFVAQKDDKTKTQILDKKYQRNMKFCKGKISWKDYLQSVEEEEKAENYISTTSSANKTNTYGKLPSLIHDLFNNYNRIYNIRNKKNIQTVLFKKFKTNLLKSPGFILKGIKQLRNTILLLISEVLGISVEEIIKNIEKSLKSNKMLFKSLNEGKIAIKFQTIENYIKYLKGDIVETRWVIDVISTPNILNKYKEGLNIITFKQIGTDIEIKEYDDIIFGDYYDINKNHIFIYEYPSGEIEPIILKYPGRLSQTKVFTNKDNKDYTKHFKKDEKDYIKVLKDFPIFLELWISSLFESENITNKKMMRILDKNKKYNFKLQLIDNFGKSNFIITTNNDLIPVIPSQFDINKDIKTIMNLKDLEPFMKNFEDSIDFIDNFANDINNEDYEFTRIILDEENKNIVGIELSNRLMLPIKSIKYERSSFKKYTVSKNKLYFEINNALYKKETPEVDLDFIKEKYDFEVYQRLLLEFSNFININTIYKQTLRQLLSDNTFENKMLIKETVEEILDNITIYKESELINYKKFLKYTNNKNIRQLCSIKSDFLCKDDKLIMPLHKKNTFTGILIESLITNEQARNQLFNNNINRIIDSSNFINDSKHIFVKKEPLF